MEIYRNDMTTPVQLIVPAQVTPVVGTTEITATGDGVDYTLTGITPVNGVYSIPLPFGLVDQDRSFNITLKFDYVEGTTKTYTTKQFVEVVTPYATTAEIREALGSLPETVTDSQLRRVERRIRGVIENFTGQKFGRYSGEHKVQSTGEEDLQLPSRLISLNNVTGGYAGIPEGSLITDYYESRGDGWYLGRASQTLGSDGYIWDTVVGEDGLGPGWRTKSSNPIVAPGSYRNGIWKDNVVYTISGDWGYEDVPTNVKEATLILIEDAICPDSEYRDRYIDSVKTADYQYMYAANAFRGTGSVIADQLLEPFRRPSLVVI